MKTIGLIINPIAGMGGAVGLKGTDGVDTLKKAIQLGAVPTSGEKTKSTLREILDKSLEFRLLTCAGTMGEEAVREVGIDPELIEMDSSNKISAQTSIDAAKQMMKKKVDLLLFAGGDGTARNIVEAVGNEIPVLGIPTGVKIQSSAFSINPRSAGRICTAFINNNKIEFREGEVIDLDEDQYRKGNISTRLFGYLKIPFLKEHVQRLKSGTPKTEKYTQEAIANDLAERMSDDTFYLVGPGSTTKALVDHFGLQGSLLGVDVITSKKVIANDVNYCQILKLIESSNRVELIITPIGGQGFIFGRGNQQFTPELLSNINKDQIHILSTIQKLTSLRGQPFLIDTGNEVVNTKLSGYYRVTTGYHQSTVYKAIC